MASVPNDSVQKSLDMSSSSSESTKLHDISSNELDTTGERHTANENGILMTESSDARLSFGDVVRDDEKDKYPSRDNDPPDREAMVKGEDPLDELSPTTVTACLGTCSETFLYAEKPPLSSAEQSVSNAITETQTLDRRTQSASALHNLPGERTTKSDFDSIAETNEGDDDDEEEEEEEGEDCVVTKTLYHLHSKNRTNSTNYNTQILPQVTETTAHSLPPIPTSLTNRKVSKTSPRNSPSKSPVALEIDTSISNASEEDKSFLDYTGYLMGFDYGSETKTETDTLEDAWSVATKRRGVYNLIQVPLKLERLLMFVFFICVDEFLSIFTFLPLRAAFAVGKLLSLPFRVFTRSSKPSSSINTVRRTNSRIGNVIDVLHFSILVFTGTFLSLFDISWVYHQIRGQSVIKLYVVFNVMEIFDRLCSSFGVDMLDSLGWTTASAVSFLSRNSPTPQSGGATRARALKILWLLSRVAFDYVFALVYASLHATLLLVWVVTLNVAINTKNNALITLLIANNFVELKGSVFKSYKIQNMFQIACSDGVERFQLAIFLGIMLVYTTGRNALLVTWATIFSCEVIVDWVKHAFATKFNRIPHRVYSQFSMVICHDIAHARAHSVVRSVGGSAVAKRIGFVSLPLAALTARMATKTVCRTPPLALAILFLTMIFTKVALSIGLVGHAKRRLARAEEQHRELPGEEDELDAKWYQSLANLGRYDLISKT